MSLDELKSVYFLGIGGIGMSAVARLFRQRGIAVAGYDRTETELTRALSAEGMEVHYDDNPEKIPADWNLAIYTPAVPKELNEWKFLQRANRPLMKRSEVLGLISRQMPTIAVAGTHGKTTTSCIIAHLLAEGQQPMTALLGGISKNFSSNFYQSGNAWLVVEADEFDRSFLHLEPQIAVILSTDADHLDIYGDADSLKETGYEAFAKCIRPQGTLIIRADLDLELNENIETVTFGVESGDCRAVNVRVVDGQFVFDYLGPDVALTNLVWNMPGRHNVENATAAICVSLRLGLTEQQIRKGLSSFSGIKRRFEFLVREDNRVMIDDYAHHPAEIRAAVAAARELYPGKSITGVFQPHLYSRTRDFAREFGEALGALDQVFLLPVYPAREQPLPGVNSELIASHVKGAKCHVLGKQDLLKEIGTTRPEVLLTLGAGDIDRLLEPIKKIMTGNA